MTKEERKGKMCTTYEYSKSKLANTSLFDTVKNDTGERRGDDYTDTSMTKPNHGIGVGGWLYYTKASGKKSFCREIDRSNDGEGGVSGGIRNDESD